MYIYCAEAVRNFRHRGEGGGRNPTYPTSLLETVHAHTHKSILMYIFLSPACERLTIHAFPRYRTNTFDATERNPVENTRTVRRNTRASVPVMFAIGMETIAGDNTSRYCPCRPQTQGLFQIRVVLKRKKFSPKP